MTGKVVYLVPASNETDDWEYTHHELYVGKEQVAGIEIADMDFDGMNDFIISKPVYNSLRLYPLKSRVLEITTVMTSPQTKATTTIPSSARKGGLGCLDFVVLSTLFVIFSMLYCIP